MDNNIEGIPLNKWFYIQQEAIRKNLEAGYKVMDVELSSFMDRAFNGEFDYPVCI